MRLSLVGLILLVAGSVSAQTAPFGVNVAPGAYPSLTSSGLNLLDTAGNTHIVRPNIQGTSWLIDGSLVTNNSAITSILPATFFGDSITCGWIQAQGNAAGSGPPYAINDKGCNQANGWPYLIGSVTGVPVLDYAIPADQAADIWPRQIGPQAVSPSLSRPGVYGIMIGTNDANAKGTGAYEANYNAAMTAVVSWLGIPVENKVLPLQATLGSGWSTGSNASGSYAISSTSNTSMSFSITSYGNPIYLWRSATDGVSGSVTYSLDGTQIGTWNTSSSTAINTQNSTTNTVFGIRIPAAAGTHTVSVTVTSGSAAVYGVGTMPSNLLYAHPIVALGSVPLPNASSGSSFSSGGTFYNAMTQYTSDAYAIAQQAMADGMDVRWVDNHKYLLGTSPEYTDQFHVTPLGASHLAQAFMSRLQLSPIATRAVSFTTSGSNSGYSVSGGTVYGSNPGNDAGGLSAGVIGFPVGSSGNLASFTVNINSTNNQPVTMWVITGNGCNGTSQSCTYTLGSSTTFTPNGTGQYTYYAGRDFGNLSFTSGQYLGFQQNGGTKFGYYNVNNPTSTTGYLYDNNSATSGDTFNSNGSYGADMSFNIGGTVNSGASNTDVVSILGMTPNGHCGKPAPTNAAAAQAETSIPAYVSAKAAGSITVTHASTSGMTYDVLCTAF